MNPSSMARICLVRTISRVGRMQSTRFLRSLAMQPGTTIDLGRDPDSQVELLANGVVIAYGEVVAVGSSLGVRITALARP